MRELRGGWTFDERAYLESGYTAELLELASARGVSLFERDNQILSYPSLVRVLADAAAVEIDRKREKRIRPSVLAELLRARQQKPRPFKEKPFLEALLKAYRLVLAEKKRAMGATVGLLDIYQILTLFPGQAKDYSKPEFARDLCLLDQSEEHRTADGLRVSFPASAGTRSGGTLSTVTREGQTKVYYGVAFNP